MGVVHKTTKRENSWTGVQHQDFGVSPKPGKHHGDTRLDRDDSVCRGKPQLLVALADGIKKSWRKFFTPSQVVARAAVHDPINGHTLERFGACKRHADVSGAGPRGLYEPRASLR